MPWRSNKGQLKRLHQVSPGSQTTHFLVAFHVENFFFQLGKLVYILIKKEIKGMFTL